MVDQLGIDAKIHRARECLESLGSDINAHCEYQARRRILEMESRAKNPMLQHFHVRESDPGYVPMDFPIRVGEIAYNLRSALDHLVYALLPDNDEEPSRQSEFPIFNEEAAYQKEAPRKLRGVPQDRSGLIEAFQPFRGGIGRHLWMLHLICIIDKHRHLNVVNTHTSLDARFKEGVEPPQLQSRLIGGTALYYDVQGTDHEDSVEPRAMVDVCFRDPEIEAASPGYGTASEREFQRRPPVIPVLSGCLSAVAIVAEYLVSAEPLPPAMLRHMEQTGLPGQPPAACGSLSRTQDSRFHGKDGEMWVWRSGGRGWRGAGAPTRDAPTPDRPHPTPDIPSWPSPIEGEGSGQVGVVRQARHGRGARAP